MILTDNLLKLINKKLDKSGYFRNKVASISNYSYFDIEEQMTSLMRMSKDILHQEVASRKYKKEYYFKHATQKAIWKYIKELKKAFKI